VTHTFNGHESSVLALLAQRPEAFYTLGRYKPMVDLQKLRSYLPEVSYKVNFQYIQPLPPTRSVILINLQNDIQPSVCECGSRKVGVVDYAPGHSNWCPVKAK